MIIVFLLRPLKSPTAQEMVTLRMAHEELYAKHKREGQSMYQSEETKLLTQKIERIIAPKKRKYVNIMGEYIRDCVSKNIIASSFGGGFWLYSKIHFMDNSNMGEVYWNA